jgi:prepilin-type N-terminal cleavage/methylation domain-containing protein
MIKHYGTKSTNKQDRRAGFSLAELMISMFLLSMLSLGITKLLFFSKMTAEDNLYEATALTVAISVIEQMQGVSFDLLENPPVESGQEVFEMVVEGSTVRDAYLGVENTLEVPVVTDSVGSIAKTLALTVTPRVEAMENGMGFWFSIEYSYDHPRTSRTRTQVVRSARSAIPMS